MDALSQALLDPSLLSQIDKFGNNISAVSDEALLESANPTFRQALKNLMVAATTTTVTINGTREKREEDVKNAKKLGPALEGVFARGMSNGFIRRRFLKKLVKSVRKDLLFGPLFPSSNNRGGGRGAVVAGGGFSNMLRRTLSMKQRRDLIDVLSNWDDDEYEHRNGHVLEKREELNDTSSFNTTLATVEDRGQGRRRKLINVLKAIGWVSQKRGGGMTFPFKIHSLYSEECLGRCNYDCHCGNWCPLPGCRCHFINCTPRICASFCFL